MEDLEDMEEDYAKFVNKVKNCIRQSANPSSSNAQSGTQNRLSDTTKLLLDKRRAMKWERGINNIEYHLLCHLIRIKLHEDFANYNCSKLLQAAEQLLQAASTT